MRKLVILDDIFPHPLSAFRLVEFERYLTHWPSSVAISSGAAFGALGEKESLSRIIQQYSERQPELASRVYQLDTALKNNALTGSSFAYSMFLENTYRQLELLNQFDVPFMFTLYPGGRFELGNDESDSKLADICSSNLTNMIVTQKITYDYVVEKKFCPEEKVEFLYGGVFAVGHDHDDIPRRAYGNGKTTFDLCFVSYKYMPLGEDKGYDKFIEVGRRLSALYEEVRLHVVGNFSREDLDVSDLVDKLTFYGPQDHRFFPAFYAGMDAILSPNVPFRLAPGAFDGFPTGSCIEAGSYGVCVFCTDVLDQNVAFVDKRDFVIVPTDSDGILASICEFVEDPTKLHEVSAHGQAAFRDVFSAGSQLTPRLELIAESLEST